MKDTNNDNNIAAEMEDIEINSGSIPSKAIADAQERENPERYVSPLRKGDIAIAPIEGDGIKAFWQFLGASEEGCAKLTSAAHIDKCRLSPDRSSIVLRRHASGDKIAAFNKWIVEVRIDGDWTAFSDFVRSEYFYLIPRSFNWKAANDTAFIVREGFIRRKGASAFVKVKKTVSALETENAKLLEELAALKAEMSKKS